MGKPQSTGNLVNAIAQDSSNNIGIGGAANASFKLQVTGASNFIGVLTATDGTQGLNIRAYTGGAGFGAIYSTGVTAGAGNFALAASATQTILSGVDNVNLAINSAIKLAIASNGQATFTGPYTNTSDVGIIVSASIPAINLRTASTGRFTIASNYSNPNTTSFLLGTGTNNPSTQAILLDHSTGAATFSNQVTINGPSSDWAAVIQNTNSGSGTSYGLKVQAGTSSGADATFVLQDYAGNEFFTARGNGRIGIGTNSPAGKVDIAAGTGANILIAADATNLVSINNYSSASGFQDLKIVGANQLFFTGTAGGGSVTERMRISSTGAITMSVPTSGQTLTVNGKNNNWAQEVIGSSTTGQSYGLLLTAGTNSSDSTFVAQNQAGNTNYFKIRGDGYLQSQSTYNNTTATGANLSISTSGFIERSTSSIRFKTEVEDLTIDTTDILSKMRPIWYRSLGQNDRKDWSWYGFIAEELAELEPRLVNWGYDESSYEQIEFTDDEGNIKKETKLKEDAELIPDGVQYERISVLLVAEVNKLRNEIEELKALINK